ncbi:MAG TPA: alpha/beta hydrolase [Burkholderiales bacterium]|jgi:phospholipase/carboxylesterase|nr:alpha/beta hydrolase [Burkholderiales bacterium]
MSETLPAIEIETKPKPSHAVIWLHGLGADGNDFVPVVKETKLPPLGIRFVFPHAPMRPVTINGGFVMRAWYDIAYQELAFKEDERGLRESQKLIEDLIARENARGIPSSRIVLAGFSQGGVITLQVGLRQPRRLAGLMALSAYLPMSPMVDVERNAANNTVPIFMGHGIADNIVPLTLGTTSRDTLIKLGYDVEWHQYTMPHSVCAEELVDIGAWLKRVLL